MTKDTLNAILDSMQTQVEFAQEKILSFSDRLQSDPFEAFEWGDSTMEAAATVSVFKSVISALRAKDTKATPETMYEHAMAQVMRGAMYPKTSSSQCMNIMATRNTAAWAAVADMFKPTKK